MNNEWFSDRLVGLANKNGLKQVDIVRITGASRASVSKWFSGISIPDSTYLAKLSEYFEVSVNWLLTGKDGSVGHEVSVLSEYRPRKVPLLSSVQAGMWSDTGCTDPLMSCSEWVNTTEDVSENAFALTVRGDSMYNPADRRSLIDGAIVIVDTAFNPDPSDLNHKIVVAMLDGTNEATIKEFVRDGANVYLKPLNPRYPIIPVDSNCRIVAVAKEGKIKL